MGKLIPCTGAYAKKPYYMKVRDLNIYSIEELNYYIVDNLDLLVEMEINKALIDWIKEQLQMDELSTRLYHLYEEDASNKIIILAILNSCNYYSSEEKLKIQKLIEEIENLPMIQRKIKKSNNFLLSKDYKTAEYYYTNLLDKETSAQLSVKEYANIIHNLGITKMYTVGIKEATTFFKQAYVRNQEEESLKQYLISLKLSKQDILFEEEVIKYGLDSDYVSDLNSELEGYYEDYRTSKENKKVQELEDLQETDYQSYLNKVTYILRDIESKYRRYVNGNN